MRHHFAILLTLSSLLLATDSQALTKLGQAATDPLGFSLYPVAAMHDMEGSRWSFSLSPGLWSVGEITGENRITGPGYSQNPYPLTLRGWMLGAALKRELTPNWGMGLIFGISRQSGKSDLGSARSGLAPQTAVSGTPGGAGFPGGEFSGVNGLATGFLVTYDPYSDTDGFRLPFSLGPFWASQALEFHRDFINPNNGRVQFETVEHKRTFTGWMGNVSFDFLTWKKRLRIMPGILYARGGGSSRSKYDYVVDQTQSGGSRTAYPSELGYAGKSLGMVYVQFFYRPLGLSFAYAGLPGDSAQAQTVQWTKKF